jgi:hypothetical protein
MDDQLKIILKISVSAILTSVVIWYFVNLNDSNWRKQAVIHNAAQWVAVDRKPVFKWNDEIQIEKGE